MGTVVQEGNIIYTSFGFNAKYKVDYYTVRNLKTLLCDKTFLTDLSMLFQNYAEYINGVKYYPLNIDKFISVNTATDRIKFGNKELEANTFRGNEIITIKKSILVTRFTVAPRYNNFLDYSPHTKIELYIPFFSFMTLPTNEVMNKEVSVYLSIDFDTGLGTLYIQADGKVILTNSNKLGIDVPIGSSNLNEIYKDNIANVVKIGAGVGGMIFGEGLGKLGGLALAGSGALSMAVNSSLHYNRGSLTGGTDALACPYTPYLIITRPNAIPINEDFKHIKGIPLEETKTLSTLRGFTIVKDIHLEGFPNALDEEKKLIEDEMKSGIYL